MRVIAGEFKGRRLHFVKTPLCRPTMDRVKEAMFNILQWDIEGARVLDLFSGSGSLGIEALSRGAAHVTFVDKDVSIIQKNITLLKVDNVEIIRKKVIQYLKQCSDTFDIVFIDPPYAAVESLSGSLNAISDFDILTDLGKAICEHKKAVDFALPESLKCISTKTYGQTEVSLFEK